MDDVGRWRALHEREGLVTLLGTCLTLGCASETDCATERCVREAAELAGCEACTHEEYGCTLSRCAGACKYQDEECLACLCEADCVGAFERCAGGVLALCSRERFGRPAGEEEYALSAPLLLREKSETGGLRASRLDAAAWPQTADAHFSTGFTHMVAFPLAGREYVLHYKSACGSEPCVARISPVLNDGSFAHPVYEAAWSRGFDQIEAFAAGGAMYLLRHKSGRLPTGGDAPGKVVIDRLELDAGAQNLALEPVYSAYWRTSELGSFSSIEPFVHAGETHLLLAATDRGDEVRVLRVQPTASGVELVTASEALSWSKGWDIVETFKLDERWYVFSYKSGRAGTTGEPAGQARILGFTTDQGGSIAFSPAVYQATWTPGLSHAIALARADGAQLITHEAASGRSALYALSKDLTAWPASLDAPVYSETWGFNPPWNVVEVVGQGKW